METLNLFPSHSLASLCFKTNTVCVAAHDSSSLIAKGAFSEYLKTSTTTLPTFASLTASPTSLAYQRGNLDGSPELFQFQSRDSVNVLLPTTLSKMHVDPFANKMHLFPQNVKCLPISPFRKDEIMISMRMADTFFSEGKSVKGGLLKIVLLSITHFPSS